MGQAELPICGQASPPGGPAGPSGGPCYLFQHKLEIIVKVLGQQVRERKKVQRRSGAAAITLLNTLVYQAPRLLRGTPLAPRFLENLSHSDKTRSNLGSTSIKDVQMNCSPRTGILMFL